MNQNHMLPEDPKLTAYALGELDAIESAVVADAIRDNASAQAYVAEVRALAGDLQNALAHEPVGVSLSTIELNQTEETTTSSSSNVIAFPFGRLALLSAACLAGLLVLRSYSPSKNDGFAANSQPAVATTVAKPAGIDAEVASDIARRRHEALPDGTNVNPAPLREGGLQLGRTVADTNGSTAKSTDGSTVAPLVVTQSKGLALTITPDAPKVELNAKADFPVITPPTNFALSSSDLKIASNIPAIAPTAEVQKDVSVLTVAEESSGKDAKTTAHRPELNDSKRPSTRATVE
jgi:hypothetical protein